jgi:hypothetical protein
MPQKLYQAVVISFMGNCLCQKSSVDMGIEI